MLIVLIVLILILIVLLLILVVLILLVIAVLVLLVQEGSPNSAVSPYDNKAVSLYKAVKIA